MSIILSNSRLKVEIDKPGSIYKGTRFDYTGFIRQITLDNIHTFCGNESTDLCVSHKTGAGLSNEFGIDKPIGYENCPVGRKFMKIGVGLLTRDSFESYSFYKKYSLLPADIETNVLDSDAVLFSCNIGETRGFSTFLKKKISITENNLKIQYTLFNSGVEDIITNEYCHNFLAINNSPISSSYTLELPFLIDQKKFRELVNPQKVMQIGSNIISWNGIPESDFFISSLGSFKKNAFSWRLLQNDLKLSVSESLFPKASQLNLWGAGHTVSPEMFFEINLKPGENVSWERQFSFNTL